MQQSRIFVGMVLILIFGEVLGLYGYVSNYGRANKGKLLTMTQIDRVSHSEHPCARLSSFHRQNPKSKKKMKSPRHMTGRHGKHWCLDAFRRLHSATVNCSGLSSGSCWTD
jgi:hypothetical protein